MNDTTLTIILASIPPTIAAVASLLVSLKNSHKADKTIEKADEIHVLVNSNMTKVQADLAQAGLRIADLQSVIATLVETRATAAAAIPAAIVLPPEVTIPEAPPPIIVTPKKKAKK